MAACSLEEPATMPTPNPRTGVLAAPLLLLLAACSVPEPVEPEAQEPVTIAAAQPVTAPAVVAAPVAPALPPAPKVPEPWEAWSYETAELPMGGFMKAATLQSTNTLEFDFPYAGKQRGQLMIRQMDGKVDTIVQIQEGQIQCNSFRACKVVVRLNEEPAQEYEAYGPQDNSSTTLFIDSKTLPEQIAQAQRVRVQFSAFRQGQPVLDFATTGFNRDLWMDDRVGERR